MTVVVLGGINMDFIVEAPLIAAAGETREGSRFYTTPGGKGANQAVAAARILEGRSLVEMAGLLGEDPYSDEMRAYLEASGVGTTHLGVARGAHCGVAVILIDANGENSVNAVYGSNLLVGESVARASAEALHTSNGSANILLVQHEVPLAATATAMRLARDRGATVILDPTPTRDNADHLLELATIVTPNQHEARDLTGIEVIDLASAERAAKDLRGRGIDTAIVTLAEQGVWLESATVSIHVPAPRVNPVATVGAGDAFNGGLAAGIALGLDLIDSARLGSATGALCVTRPGAQEAMPSRAEVEALLA
jgi:ribokinase